MMKKPKIKKLKKQKNKNVQRFTQVQNLGNVLSAKEFKIIKRMSHSAKALRNVGLYAWKQADKLGQPKTISMIDRAMQADINYWGNQSNSVQAIRKQLLTDINSYFSTIEDWKKNPQKYLGKPKFPKYKKSLEKQTIQIFQVSKVDKGGYWKLPMNSQFEKRFGKIKIRMPKNLRDKKVTYIEIVPKHNGRFFEAHYTYEIDKAQMKIVNTTSNNVMGIDFGVNNLMSCATNSGESFIIDGRKLKSLNRYFNKEIGKLQTKNIKNGISKKVITDKQAKLWQTRTRQINGYLDHAVGILFSQARELGIDTIVVGHNPTWKQNSKIGKKNNQQFVKIPFAKLMSVIENKCMKEGIKFIKQDESYTSKASFLDNDEIPNYDKGLKNKHFFSGQRIKRGLYQSANGTLINADINGALNIMRKANIAFSNMEVITPKIIRVQM